MRQPQVPSKQDTTGNDSMKFDSRDASNNNDNKSTGDAKSRVSSPISNSQSTVPQSSSIFPANSSSSNAPMSAIGQSPELSYFSGYNFSCEFLHPDNASNY